MLFRSRHVFFGLSALLFAASAAVTIQWSMAMPEMAMPGGTDMRMPGQGWSALSFLVMWMVMMAAMMLPSLAPALWRYREALSGASDADAAGLTACAAAGYFFVWLLIGIALFPLVPVFTAMAGGNPTPVAGLLIVAGLLQFTRWKTYHLACCRRAHNGPVPADRGAAWRFGLRLGRHCSVSSAGPTAILLAVGMMDLRMMVLATAAITAERLAPDAERVARLIGVLLVATGLFLLVSAAG